MGKFGGKRILILEDEALIAMMLEDTLVDLGCDVVGPATDIATGQQFARADAIDGAILDVNIGGQTSEAVAKILQDRNIPYLLATGYGPDDLPTGASGLLNKPYRAEDVKTALQTLFG